MRRLERAQPERRQRLRDRASPRWISNGSACERVARSCLRRRDAREGRGPFRHVWRIGHGRSPRWRRVRHLDARRRRHRRGSCGRSSDPDGLERGLRTRRDGHRDRRRDRRRHIRSGWRRRDDLDPAWRRRHARSEDSRARHQHVRTEGGGKRPGSLDDAPRTTASDQLGRIESCTISRRSPSIPGRWSAWKRSCVGSTRSAGWCPPNAFIPDAERSGLNGPLTLTHPGYGA